MRAEGLARLTMPSPDPYTLAPMVRWAPLYKKLAYEKLKLALALILEKFFCLCIFLFFLVFWFCAFVFVFVCVCVLVEEKEGGGTCPYQMC